MCFVVSEKARFSVSVDPENKEWIDQTQQNRSTFINELITAARTNGCNSESVIRDYRLQQLRSDLERRRAEIDSIQSEIESLQAIQEREEQQKQTELENAEEALADVPLKPDNPAVLNWAEKLELAPDELIQELED